MNLLVDREELATEFLVALDRVVDCVRMDSDTNHIAPVTVPLSEKGETVSITTYNASSMLTGDGRLVAEFSVPRNLLNVDEIESLDYAREVYDSEALDILHEVLSDVFKMDEVSFMVSKSTHRTITFRETIPVDPTMIPTDEDHEIVPVVTLSVEKKWIYKDKERNITRQARDNNEELVLKPSESSVEKLEFGDTVRILGNEFEVEKQDEAIALVSDGNVYAYVPGLSGPWVDLIDAEGEYKIESFW